MYIYIYISILLKTNSYTQIHNIYELKQFSTLLVLHCLILVKGTSKSDNTDLAEHILSSLFCIKI